MDRSKPNSFVLNRSACLLSAEGNSVSVHQYGCPKKSCRSSYCGPGSCQSDLRYVAGSWRDSGGKSDRTTTVLRGNAKAWCVFGKWLLKQVKKKLLNEFYQSEVPAVPACFCSVYQHFFVLIRLLHPLVPWHIRTRIKKIIKQKYLNNQMISICICHIKNVVGFFSNWRIYVGQQTAAGQWRDVMLSPMHWSVSVTGSCAANKVRLTWNISRLHHRINRFWWKPVNFCNSYP